MTRAIQNSPIEVLIELLSIVSEKVLSYLASSHYKTKTQILEALISLVVAVEVHFEEYAVPYIPHLIESL